MVVENHLSCLSLPEVEGCGVGRCSPSGATWWCLDDLWSLHCYDYHAGFQVGGHRYQIEPGTVSLVPPRVEMSYVWTKPVRHPYALFRLPTAGGEQRIPVLQQRPPGFAAALVEAAGWWPLQPDRVAVRLLDLLWRLTVSDGDRQISLLDRAAALIGEHLADPLPIPELARRCGVAHNTMTRHVQRRLGMTVVAWIRRQRAEHARGAMLLGATPSEAAASIGITDAQRFNKLIRQVYGRSPSQLL